MQSLIYTPVEMLSIFGFNPVTNPDFKQLSIRSDSTFRANLKNRTFEVIDSDNNPCGSFEMNQDDFVVSLGQMANIIVDEIMADTGIEVHFEVESVKNTGGNDTDVVLSFWSDESVPQFDIDNGEQLSELGNRIAKEVMNEVGCAGPLPGSYSGRGDENEMYFHFENCVWPLD